MTTVWLVLALGSGAVLLHAWVLYPIIMERRAGEQSRPAPPVQDQLAPTVSAILVTRDDAAPIRARLEDLLLTSYPLAQVELIIAFDGPPANAELADLAPRFRRLVGVRSDPPGGKACGLNSAVREASGDILLFTDTHQRFERDAIPRLVASLQQGPWSVVSGALHLHGSEGGTNLLTGYWRRERNLREAEARVHSSVGVTGAIYAMWRDRWSPLPAGLILDDLFVPMRLVLAGERVGFTADAVAMDTRSTTPAQEFQRKVRTLTGNIQLCAWLPGVVRPGKNPIWFAFVSHKLLRLLSPYALAGVVAGALGLLVILTPWLVVVLLALAAAGAGFALLGNNRVSRKLRSAVLWGLMMQFAAVVATVNGLRGNWKVWNLSSKPTRVRP